jgi:multiple sugar transport system substrate-binding protein
MSTMQAVPRLALVLLLALVPPFAAAEGSKEAAAAPVTLTVWTRLDQQSTDIFYSTFQKVNPTIKLEVEHIPGGKNHINKLVAAVAARSMPDCTTLDVVATDQFVGLGALRAIDDWMAQDPALSAALFPPGPLKTGQVDGKQYALPFGGDASIVPYNKALYRERGLDPERPPETWDAFTDAAKRLTFDRNGDGTPDVYGFLFIPSQPWLTTFYWLPYFWMAGGDFVDREKMAFTLSSEAGVKALSYLMDLHLKHKAVPPSAIGAAASTDNLLDFVQGRVAMCFAGPNVVPRVQRDMPQFSLGIMTHPSPSRDVPRTSFAGGDNVAVTSSVPANRTAAARQWLKFMTSVEGQRLWLESKVFQPVRKELLEDPYFKEHPLENTILKSYLAAHDPPRTAHYVEVQQYLRDAFEEVALKGVTPKAALDKAVERGNELIKRTGRP